MADNWEYHQDQRDRAAAIGGLIVIGVLVLIALAVAAMVTLLFMDICR